ncbi:MAG: ABC transporter substrate-binding protein [Sphingobacteriales bacterium]|nr:ABC transporter substrate-binding protein [Sphingobacteriales bacterium]
MQKRRFIDQTYREIEIPFPPKRIISLVPSQTELLFDLDLDEEIIGITKFCVHPEAKFKIKEKIGGTKQLNLAKIRSLKPDLIIGNKEENEQQQIEELMEEYPVWMSDIYNLKDALEMIKSIGELVDRQAKAKEIANEIQKSLEGLIIYPVKKVLYFIWKEPYMLAGKNTFIDEMLHRGGFENIIQEQRYPELSLEQLSSLKPDAVFLSSEPYPFKEKHVKTFQEIWPEAQIQLVDGELFSWYGSRLLKSANYFRALSGRFLL